MEQRAGQSPQPIPEPQKAQAPAAPTPRPEFQQQGQTPTQVPTPEQLRALDTPENRQKVEDFAKRNNLTPEQAMERLQRSFQKNPPQQPAQQQQPPPPPPSELNPEQRSTGPRTSIDLPGGLGQIQFVGLRPEHIETVRRAVAGLNLLPTQQATTPLAQQASLGDQPTMPTINGKPVTSHLDLAKSLLGKNETDDRTALVSFFKSAMGSSINPATTPWCARFANAVLAAAGQKGTGSDMARSFLNYGVKVDPSQAKAGDIIVFPRTGSPVFGHVGFVESVNLEKGTVRVLGGNQGGSAQKGGGVTVQTFPLSRALGVRRVTTQTVAELMSDGSTAFA